MGLSEFGADQGLVEEADHHCAGHQDHQQQHVVEVVGDEVEGLIGSHAHQEEVGAGAEGEDGGLHVGGAEHDAAEVGQGQVVAEVVDRHVGQHVLVLRQFLVGEEALPVFDGSPGADHVPVDVVDLVLAGDNQQVAAGQRHLGLAHEHLLDSEGQSEHLLFEDSLLPVLLGFVVLFLEVVGDDGNGGAFDSLLVLLDGPYLVHLVAGVEVGHEDVVLVVGDAEGQSHVHVVLVGVELHLARPAVDRVHAHVGVVQRRHHRQVGEVHVLEEHLLPVVERNVGALVAPESRSHLQDLLPLSRLEGPHLCHHAAHHLPARDLVLSASVEVELLLLRLVFIGEQAVPLDLLPDHKDKTVAVEFVEERWRTGREFLQQHEVALLCDPVEDNRASAGGEAHEHCHFCLVVLLQLDKSHILRALAVAVDSEQMHGYFQRRALVLVSRASTVFLPVAAMMYFLRPYFIYCYADMVNLRTELQSKAVICCITKSFRLSKCLQMSLNYQLRRRMMSLGTWASLQARGRARWV